MLYLFNKRILSLLVVALTFCAPLHAVVSDDDFERISDYHLEDYHAKKLCDENDAPFYFRLEDEAVEGLEGPQFLVATGSEINNPIGLSRYASYLSAHPDTVLLLDVKKGDGFVSESGVFNFKRSCLTNQLKHLWITNIDQDVTKLGSDFLSYSDAPIYCRLETINFSKFGRLKRIERRFLSYTKIESIDFSFAPRVKSFGKFFLDRCDHIQSLDLSVMGLDRPAGFQHSKLRGLRTIENYQKLRLCSLRCVIAFLRSSDVPEQLALAEVLQKNHDERQRKNMDFHSELKGKDQAELAVNKKLLLRAPKRPRPEIKPAPAEQPRSRELEIADLLNTGVEASYAEVESERAASLPPKKRYRQWVASEEGEAIEVSASSQVSGAQAAYAAAMASHSASMSPIALAAAAAADAAAAAPIRVKPLVLPPHVLEEKPELKRLPRHSLINFLKAREAQKSS